MMNNNQSDSICRRVNALADQLLAQAGCDWRGHQCPKSKEAREQVAFERRMVRTPTGGVNGRHR